MLVSGVAQGQSGAAREEGIPVNDPLLIAKCASCHPRDAQGNMERISWERTTPEGWQDALKQAILGNGVSVTRAEARAIVKYLSTYHGLAPQEAKPVMYEAERRLNDELDIPSDSLREACAKCHSFARALSWRRSREDWKQFAESHAKRHKIPMSEEAVAFFAKAAPLHTPEWEAWKTHTSTTNLAGRWLLTASILGHGRYYGEMQVDRSGEDEFATRVKLTSVLDASTIQRTGISAAYGGYAWRGRSKGNQAVGSAPDDLASEMREVLWIAPDQSTAEGRWFWGQYQEFGLDVKLRKAPGGPTLVMLDRVSLKVGSQGSRIRLIGENLPAQVAAADLDFGPGVRVRSVVSHTASDVVAVVDVADSAPVGRHSVAVRGAVLPDALAIFDRIDYVKVAPESSLAAFADATRPTGYQQFDAIGYQRGADGVSHTADDVELGPVDVNWSLKVFYSAEGSGTDFVGKMSLGGLFTPASNSPNNNFDVWVIGTAKSEMDKNGKPLVGKSYLVVTVPMYTFNGRRFVRDLGRWVDDGPATGTH
jgi:quinohemoprotein amine dehydrogenase